MLSPESISLFEIALQKDGVSLRKNEASTLANFLVDLGTELELLPINENENENEKPRNN